jgi:hypothetical protein
MVVERARGESMARRGRERLVHFAVNEIAVRRVVSVGQSGKRTGSGCERFGARLEDCGQQQGQSAQSGTTRHAQDEPRSSQSRTVATESAPEPQRCDAGADDHLDDARVGDAQCSQHR